MFDAISFLKDRAIPYSISGENVGEGWVGITCPFCDDQLDHGGFNLVGGYYHCWKCGGHNLAKVVAELDGCNYKDAKIIIENYEVDFLLGRKKQEEKTPPNSLKLPGGPLLDIHKNFLLRRKFDPACATDRWNLRGVGPVGEYNFRLIVPIVYKKRIVSYQGRDVTGESKLRYKTCKSEDELIKHKHILYNLDNVKDVMILCEGVFDVWRMGDGAVATFGTSVMNEQINCIINHKPRLVVGLFDPEKEAQKKIIKILQEISVHGIKTKNIVIDAEDPAELTEHEVILIRKEII